MHYNAYTQYIARYAADIKNPVPAFITALNILFPVEISTYVLMLDIAALMERIGTYIALVYLSIRLLPFFGEHQSLEIIFLICSKKCAKLLNIAFDALQTFI